MMLLALVLAALPLAAPPAQTATQPVPARRFVLAVGENRGDAADEPLRWAEADAQRFLEVLATAGGVSPGDAVALLGADADDLTRAIERLEERLAREAAATDQLVLYVSSHADSGELHLQGTRFPVQRLLDALRRAPVQVAILVVDSCRSGVATRLKGLAPAAQGTTVRIEAAIAGRVVISSSGSDEFAQESDRLGGSYFTHHLVAGLRGAADASGDGRVTLTEAYGYAYSRTVESTFGTAGGPQHPSYHVDLVGQGDLVLTEPVRGQSRLRIAVEPPGDWLVLSERGEVVAEWRKPSGPTVLVLAPGSYRVGVRGEREHREARVQVTRAGGAELTEADLRPASQPLVAAVAKGARASWLHTGLALTAATGLIGGTGPRVGGELSLRLHPRGGLGPLRFVELGGGVRYGRASGDVRFKTLEVELLAGAGRDFHVRSLEVRAAALLGGTLIDQFGLIAERDRLGFVPRVGLTGTGGFPLSERLGAFVGLEVGLALVKTPQGLQPAGLGRAQAGVSVGW